MSRDIDEVRQKIHQMHETLEESNHYELLGLSREDFDSSELGGVYRKKAKEWHIDRYSGYDLESQERAKLQEIFSAINNAYRILSRDDEREEYNYELDGEEAEDVSDLLGADTLFLRGKNMLKQNSYKGAHDLFEQALELSPENPSIRAHTLYAEYLLIPKSGEGRPVQTKRAREIFEELTKLEEEEFEDVDWILVFLGIVSMGLGKSKKAGRLFKHALYINPSNLDAKRQRRLIEMRREREASKGFFEKLMDRFKG